MSNNKKTRVCLACLRDGVLGILDVPNTDGEQYSDICLLCNGSGVIKPKRKICPSNLLLRRTKGGE